MDLKFKIVPLKHVTNVPLKLDLLKTLMVHVFVIIWLLHIK
jgi:hypothetical protein